jgi:hypothetical protein
MVFSPIVVSFWHVSSSAAQVEIALPALLTNFPAQHWNHLAVYLWIATPAMVLLFAAWWLFGELAVPNHGW